jgi:hypothetical protein
LNPSPSAPIYQFEQDGHWVQASDRADDGVLADFFPVYDAAFVLANEKEGMEGFIDCLALNHGGQHDDLRATCGQFRELVLVVRGAPEGPVLGGANILVLVHQASQATGFDYTLNLNYVFVTPGQRGKHLSRVLLAACQHLAAELVRGQPSPSVSNTPPSGLIFLEINDPFRLTPEQYRIDSEHAGIDQLARLAYWSRMGAKVLNWSYVQPALSADQKDDDTLCLAVIGAPEGHLAASLVLYHLERFFAISVLKGQPVKSNDSAHAQVVRLRRAAGTGAGVTLLGLSERLSRLSYQLRQSLVRPLSLPMALQDMPPTAFFTLSLLIDSAQINQLIHKCSGDSGRKVWSQRLLEAIQASYMDTQWLQGAINPMFDDIADRARNLFIEDFLLDTPNAAGPRSNKPLDPEHRDNVCAEISLELPGHISWKAEGPEMQVAPGSKVRFEKVLCRAFWMAHSNHALSYHLSFEVPFEHRLGDYFGLSLFQKAFFLSESTDWLIDDEDKGWRVELDGQKDHKRLLAFIEGMFETHLGHLMGHVVQAAKMAKLATLSPDLPAACAKLAWQRLVLDEPDGLPSQVTTSRQWSSAKVKHRRRLLVLLRDAVFFEALKGSHKETDRLMALSPLVPRGAHQDANQDDVYPLAVLDELLDEQVGILNGRPDAQGQPIQEEVYKIWLFLSGFFQNVVDFLDQDGLEVYDGLAPIYPSQSNGDGQANEGFMLYATPRVLYEVVKVSRSLDKAGRRWLGTCPYLFLVHMTAFHNESLVHAYEHKVTDLVRDLEEQGLLVRPDAEADARVPGVGYQYASDRIKKFRLATFEQVHKHYSFNVFRYETEQAFFETIEDVRGIAQRRRYWDEVLAHLTETIQGLQDDSRAEYEKKIAWFGLLLAMSGLLQVWFMVFPLTQGHELSGLLLEPLNITLILEILLAGIWFKKGDLKLFEASKDRPSHP